MRTITIGVLGAGRIGKLHTENLLQNFPTIHLKTIADPHFDIEWAKRLPKSIHLTNDPAEVLSDPEIEAILICSPTPYHAEQIIAAAAAHKHAFCEKPISTDVAQIKAVIKSVQQAGTKLQIGFNRRFDPNFAKVKALVANEDIGTPHLVRITSRDPKIPPIHFLKSSGGMFLDMTIHDFDMASYLIDSPIEEIYATGKVLIDPMFSDHDDIDTAVINLKFANGALGVIDNSRQAVYGYDQRVEVFGSKGSIQAENNKPTNTILSTKDGIATDLPLYYFLERYKESFIAELMAFFNCIRQDLASPVSGEAGLSAVLIALAAEESLRVNRPIKINQFP